MSVKVDQAFVSQFVAEAFGLPIAHENDLYTPTSGTAYVELKMLPNPMDLYTLNDSNITTGVFRIYLNYPPQSGAIAAKSMADTIGAAFPLGSKVEYDDVTCTVISQHRRPALVESGWYRLILDLSYRAMIDRAT